MFNKDDQTSYRQIQFMYILS